MKDMQPTFRHNPIKSERQPKRVLFNQKQRQSNRQRKNKEIISELPKRDKNKAKKRNEETSCVIFFLFFFYFSVFPKSKKTVRIFIKKKQTNKKKQK